MGVQLSSLDLYYLSDELHSLLVGTRLDQVYQYSSTHVLFQLYKQQVGKLQLLCALPSFAYITSDKPESLDEQISFCAYLRKILVGMHVKSISQVGFSRILSIKFEIKEKKYTVFFELYDKGNIIICIEKDGSYLIEQCAQVQRWTSRTIQKGEIYQPQVVRFPHELTTQDLQDLVKSNTQGTLTLSKFLATKLGFGGTYAGYLCEQASLEHNSPITSENIARIAVHLKAIFSQAKKPTVFFKNSGETSSQSSSEKGTAQEIPFAISPFDYNIKDCSKKHFDTLSAAYAYCVPKIVTSKESKRLSAFEQELKKYQVILQTQQSGVEILEKEIDANTKQASFIYEHYQEIQLFLEQYQKLRKAKTDEELRKLFPAIVKQSGKDKTVTIRM